MLFHVQYVPDELDCLCRLSGQKMFSPRVTWHRFLLV